MRPLLTKIPFVILLIKIITIEWSQCSRVPPATSHQYFIHLDEIVFDHNAYKHTFEPNPNRWHLPTMKLTPLELMIDLSNDLGFRLLHRHSVLNRNNFAFSPTALLSVLMALYEGAESQSALELRYNLHLPLDRDIIRIGSRDIHRRLKTYFFKDENPLKGLSFNRNNFTITEDYETILMFYGYDLNESMIPPKLLPPTSQNTPINRTEPVLLDVRNHTNGVTKVTKDLESSIEVKPNVTEKPQIIASTTSPSPTENSLKTTEISTTTITTTTLRPPAKTATQTLRSILSEQTPTINIPLADSIDNSSRSKNPEIAELISTFAAVEPDAEPFLRIQKAQVTQLPTGDEYQAPNPTYLPSIQKPTTTRRNHRRRITRHLLDIDYNNNDYSDLLTALLQQRSFQPYFYQNTPHFVSPINDANSPTGTALHSKYEEIPRFFTPIALTQQTETQTHNYNTDVINHIFHLNDHQTIHTTFKIYNAVLHYKYFDHLQMSVLQLELDTPEYNLIIFLPDFITDFTTLLSGVPPLRSILKQLKPRWVEAIIPDFTLEGSIFLTNDLQNLGICAIFEPSRANFRSMTDEKGIYIKHIQQWVNVKIRTRPINQINQIGGEQQKAIPISVNQPFLFFIVDRDLDVAVMAGRILNPLNVRIQ